ncbi:hypothetical protein Cni_G24040 [Canna indica]|uniref:RING-type domain-containing protein n=1 Tax=Canna indica TaxID=4628 RepID=A0AAQ3KV55_9LILI|nr:hypothetical protein Cni_G24040 [Canna indica]
MEEGDSAEHGMAEAEEVAVTGPAEVVEVKREQLAACMTCPLCHKLLRDATTISECLHTFCRKCIYEKLTDEEVDCCPICNINLGCIPLEKLRPDHSLQDLRAKMFPFKKRKVEALENFPLIPSPGRRKERSLSSLVVNTPCVASQTGLTGRRTRAVTRRAAISRGISPGIHETNKSEDASIDRRADNSSENPSKLGPTRRQEQGMVNGGESYQDKIELWKPLNCLVEAANRTKSLKSSSQGPVIKEERTKVPDREANIHKIKLNEHLHNSKIQDEKNNSIHTPAVIVRAKRLQGVNGKRKELASAQALVNPAIAQCERRISPIWFQLIASFNQEGDSPLPQIRNSYLRIKDGNVPVSFIQKYLVRKLDLDSEAEVGIAIMCRGQPVSSSTTLYKLVDQWLQGGGGSSQRLQASVGTSAKEFVMVLTEQSPTAASGAASHHEGEDLIGGVTDEGDSAEHGMAAAAVGAAGQAQVVTVKREQLVSCMTCPLCHKLLRDATTISECLHTFCRKCIYEKLTDEEADCCPICNINLGCLPIEKLRPDHNLQDLRAKIFPFKRRKVEALENFPLVTLPARRKERSLSSLVVNTPRVAAQTSLTGRRTRAVTRRAATSRGISPGFRESNKSEDDSIDRRAENTSDNPSKLGPSRRQNAESSCSTATKEQGMVNGGESYQDKTELWKPLNCLVEVANRTKSLKSSSQGPVINEEHMNVPDGEASISKTKLKEHLNKSKVQDEKNNNVHTPPVTGRARRLQGVNGKRKDLASSTQALLNAASAQCDRRICPIWFQLIASFNQEGDPPLPQIQNSYLRIKDGNVPVSFIQKYLVRKLDLDSEAEVGIMCRGQPVSPATSLYSLVDQWLQGGSSQRLQASVGTSAKEFVMVLAYGRRKVPTQ